MKIVALSLTIVLVAGAISAWVTHLGRQRP